MMRRVAATLLVCTAVLAVWPAAAVQPDEQLTDPVLEQRARAISTGLRCLVCQNQSIDDSNAGLARDLRLLVRQRLQAGDSDAQVSDYLVARYGEFVLLKPPFQMSTLLLWLTPAFVLLAGGLAAWLRGNGAAKTAAGLSSDEEAQLARIVGTQDRPGVQSKNGITKH